LKQNKTFPKKIEEQQYLKQQLQLWHHEQPGNYYVLSLLLLTRMALTQLKFTAAKNLLVLVRG
jgi:hypothetical protein